MSTGMTTRRRWLGRLLALCGVVPLAQPDDVAGRRQFTMTARKFQFDPEIIDVRRNDIVRLTITSADIDHSFTIDAYRIQKRIPAGGSVTLEFRADEVGRFPFYCSMRIDPGCEDMSGELIVR
ncbi:nitrous-oxide reductase, Sec-dependent [Luteitalea pratensis]|uniref:Nitrous-oxide reductase, Sec-dependent n=2 Tax=Luteitalea pratensis TaxID=1855912 RepID=A0A143PTY9_LUTPR|nr:nitrous-oxide reductase, Sec-dependent [Luteitalea pratensis]